MSKYLTQIVKEGNLKELKKQLSSKRRLKPEAIREGIHTVDLRGQNILHKAVEANQLEIVKFLIEAQSMDPNMPDKSKWTPLHIGCAAGNLDIVDYLLMKVMVNIYVTSVDKSTPLHYFVRHLPQERISGQSSVKKKLVRRFKSDDDLIAPHDGLYFRTLEALSVKRGKECNIMAKNKNGDTPLHIASTRGNVHVVRFLLDHETDVNARNKYLPSDLPCLALILLWF